MRKIIPGLPGYKIDEKGNVWSYIVYGPGDYVRKQGRLLKSRISKGGYIIFNLHKNKKQLTTSAHRLLMITFKPTVICNLHVRHLDGNPQNNNLNNLAWGTAKDNARDCYSYGRPPIGENNNNAKITESLAVSLKNFLALGIKKITLSRAFGLGYNILNKIDRGESWQHIQSPIEQLCKKI